MRKTSSTAFGLSALTALLLVGGGVKPARADWARILNTGNVGKPSAEVTAPAANANKSRVSSPGDVTHDDKTGTEVTVTCTMLWYDPNGNIPPQSSTFKLKGQVNWSFGIFPGQVDGPTGASATMLASGPNLVGTGWSSSKTYNYRSHQIESSTDTPVFHLDQSFVRRVEYADSGDKYYTDISYNVKITNTADIQSSYYPQGANFINSFPAQVTSGSTSFQPNAVEAY